MIYIASFAVFVFFAGAMALGMIVSKRQLKTEDEATAEIMRSINCAACTSTLCSLAGRKDASPRKGCEAKLKAIPHRNV
ncbi:MAG: hypothetical protein PUI29_07975 [Aeromonadales bacterium]|nr:hypothetical protein [Aeromonadales bacterium]MDY2889988.1 hypothetical protein [Succinivibrio sp.]